jgi:type I restriction-modification system DNA methylase subunit
MSSYTEHLTRLRRQEQEARGYATSSRWYTGLSHAISFLERAETGTDPLHRFLDAWWAAYNLFLLHGRSGDDEHKCFNRWVSEVKDIPEVRRAFSTSPETVPISAFRTTVNKTKNTLLKPQGIQGLQAWSAKSASPDKACRYFFDIVRDMRNTCAHPDFNPKSAAVKQALTAAADCLVPIVAAAIQTMIEQPVEGTTGRTTAYRSFLWPFLKNADSFFSDYYLERLLPEEELDAFPEEEARELLKSLARQYESLRSTLVTADAEATRQQWCVPILFQALAADVHAGVRLITDDGIYEPSYVLKQAELSGEPRQEYQGKEAGRDLACLLWVLPWRSSLDVIVTDGTSEPLPMMEVAHRALTHSDVPWVVLTNGQQLRLLARGTAHKPRCFLEIDLAAVVDRRGDAEALLAFRYGLGLFSGASFTDKDGNDHTRLERVLIGSERHGKEIGDELKQNVFRALEALGDGFLHYLRTHPAVLEEWRTQKGTTLAAEAFLASEQLLEDIYHESLSLMYRLLFLFYAESRNLLPMEDEIYRESYSLESIRDDIISVHDDPDPKRFFGQGDSQLWERLTELFRFLNTGWRGVIPAYNGGLFDPELHKFLEQCKVPDYFLAWAIDLLSRTQPRSGQSRGEGRKKVTYRDLDIRHLGSIYEGILEYSAHIADQDMVVMQCGSGGKAYEEYVPVAVLAGSEKQQLLAWRQAVEEDPDNPQPPRGCKVTGLREQGSYFLVYGGRESKRKSSGSYYTPDYIVQYIVQNTLGPLVRGECRPKHEPLSDELKRIGAKKIPAPTGPLSPDEILDLKVLDPAMGSGHFLVAATEFLARAYGEALLREGQIAGDVISDEEFIRHKRMIVERCIYGVDINPLAVELAKLSLWLFTMDPSRPLSFLDHHLKCGNSLIGAWLKDLGRLPEFDRSGKPKKTQLDDGQGNLFEQQFRARVPLMIRDLFGIMNKETLTPDDIETKKVLDAAVEGTKRPFKNIANTWVGPFFGEETKDYNTLLSNVDLAYNRHTKPAEDRRFFHWELEFPELFFDPDGKLLLSKGFDAIITNPPYVFARQTIDELDRIYYSNKFQRVSKDESNLYVMFIDISVDLVKECGRIGVIVPNAILSIDSTQPLRGLLLKQSPPQICIVCLYNVFENVIVEPAVCIFECGSKAEICLCKVQLSPDGFGEQAYPTSLSRWKSLPNQQFAAFTSEEAGTLFDRIVNQCVPLGEVSSVRAALQAYEVGKGTPPQSLEDVQNHVFDRNEKDSPNTHPYLDGADVQRYSIKWKSSWLSYGPWLSQPRDISTFSEPRVLVREVTGRYPRMLIAAPTTELYLNNKSILNVICNLQSRHTPWIITGILNSKLGSFIFKHFGVKANRGLFPKVVIADLQKFPIPRVLDTSIATELEAVVRSMCQHMHRTNLEDQALQKHCDLLVYSLYGLTEKDAQVVDNEIEVTLDMPS